jgi:hypothetical protein
MTPEERASMERLCQRIAVEKDPTTFNDLVAQLNDLLEKKEHRLRPDRKSESS